MTENTVMILHTEKMMQVVDFFTEMGLPFKQEKHGNGQLHYALEMGGKVFEVYPQHHTGVPVRFMK